MFNWFVATDFLVGIIIAFIFAVITTCLVVSGAIRKSDKFLSTLCDFGCGVLIVTILVASAYVFVFYHTWVSSLSISSLCLGVLFGLFGLCILAWVIVTSIRLAKERRNNDTH